MGSAYEPPAGPFDLVCLTDVLEHLEDPRGCLRALRDQMAPGDGVLFYHSSCAEPGIAGLAEVASPPYPDATQFDPQSKYHDPAARPEAPRWIHVDIRALRKTRLVGIAELRQHPELEDLLILRRGNRLSITPVTAAQWRFITARLLKASA